MRFEDLVLGEPVAAGGGGTVYRGTYAGQVCAIKELHMVLGVGSNTSAAADLELLKRETTLMARLRHPNLVSFWGNCVGGSPQRFYLVMEYCPTSLDKVLEQCQAEGSFLLSPFSSHFHLFPLFQRPLIHTWKKYP